MLARLSRHQPSQTKNQHDQTRSESPLMLQRDDPDMLSHGVARILTTLESGLHEYRCARAMGVTHLARLRQGDIAY